MNKMKLKAKYSYGLTLVETIVVVSLFSLLMIAVMSSVSSLYRVNAYTMAQSYQVSNARRGMEIMIRDIREMIASDNGAFPLVVMKDNEIGFYSDIDRDNSVEYVEYFLVASTTLTKNVYNATGTPSVYNLSVPDQTFILSEYVQNLELGTSTFTFFEKNGLMATSGTSVIDIRYISAKIMVNIDPVRDPGKFMLRSSASLRNLKDNF